MERHAIQERVGGNYEHGSMFVCVFNGRYKLWWNITSLFMCVCQHMWVERCASEELFLFNRVGGIFVCVYLYIGEFVSSAGECQRRGGGEAKWRLGDAHVILAARCQRRLLCICLFLYDNMITLCTCWLQSACCHLTPEPTTFLCSKLQFFFHGGLVVARLEVKVSTDSCNLL